MNLHKNWPLLLIASLAIVTSSCNSDTEIGTGEIGTSSIIVDETYTVASVTAQNAVTHDQASDYVWDAAAEKIITLNGNSISSNASAVSISGSHAIITAAGVYRISGQLTNGQIGIASADEEPVRLILDGAAITNATGSAIVVADASKTIIILADGSVNKLSDGADYTFPNSNVTEPNATLYSKDPLTIAGSGTLYVDANFADAITSKDGLVVTNGAKINITAKDDGIKGKDYLYIKNAQITAQTGGDALKSNNDSLANMGFVHIADGTFDLSAGADGIQATSDILIETGLFIIKTGGGASATLASGATAKGLKTSKILVIDGGTFDLSTSDDALHSNTNLTINGGIFEIASNDDGLHADTSAVINGGNVTVTKSLEGLESAVVIINGGEMRLTSSDDGVNVAGGADGSASGNFGKPAAGNPDFYLKITGGYLFVNAASDGLDANGSIRMSGGTVVVFGSTADNNAAVDFDLGFEVTGGTLAAVGSSRMAQVPGGASTATQNALLVVFSSTQAAGQNVRVESETGETIMALQPSKSYASLGFTSPKFETGKKYKIILGGTSSNNATDGLFAEGAVFSGGDEYTSFTVSDIVTTIK